MTLLELPNEHILPILAYLNVDDVVSRQAAEFTHSKSVWHDQFNYIRHVLPFSSLNLLPMTSESLERCVRRAHHIQKQWSRPRKHLPTKLLAQNIQSGPLLGFTILDIYLISIYSSGYVFMWKLDAIRPREHANSQFVCAVVKRGDHLDTRWHGYAVSGDPSGSHIYLAFATHRGAVTFTKLVRIPLEQAKERGANVEHICDLHIPVTSASVLHHLSVQDELLLFSTSSGSLLVYPWGETHGNSSPGVTLSQPEQWVSDELWNGVVCARFAGRNMVVVIKTRTVEVYENIHHTDSVAIRRYHINEVAFRSVSMTSFKLLPESGGMSFRFLGLDTTKGVLRYSVLVPPNSEILDVSSLNLGNPAPTPMPSAYTNRTVKQTQRNSLEVLRNSTGADLNGLAFAAPSSGSQGNALISTVSIGPQGKRAIWVERKRGSMVRELVASDLATVEKDEDARAGWDSQTVIVRLPSYDLRDDITHCALDEIRGTVFFTNRKGEIFAQCL
ncbi:hypothetical protein DL96DRAFT_1704927 [Flagelloscypha sp. PMI_526]|nr:hypothetical protein DL96DRAFT_1704927 [Flagelloscypha sp. PMI_526]